MDENIAGVIAGLEAAIEELARGGSLPAGASLAAWRRAVSTGPEGPARDRAMWALLGAERCAREAALDGGEATAARVRLEAALRALRGIAPIEEAPPDPV